MKVYLIFIVLKSKILMHIARLLPIRQENNLCNLIILIFSVSVVNNLEIFPTCPDIWLGGVQIEVTATLSSGEEWAIALANPWQAASSVQVTGRFSQSMVAASSADSSAGTKYP